MCNASDTSSEMTGRRRRVCQSGSVKPTPTQRHTFAQVERAVDAIQCLLTTGRSPTNGDGTTPTNEVHWE